MIWENKSKYRVKNVFIRCYFWFLLDHWNDTMQITPFKPP